LKIESGVSIWPFHRVRCGGSPVHASRVEARGQERVRRRREWGAFLLRRLLALPLLALPLLLLLALALALALLPPLWWLLLWIESFC